MILFIAYTAKSQANIDNLKEAVKKLEAVSNSHVGISIFDLQNKKEIFSSNSNKTFTPASVLKLFYTLAAVETKGKNFKFSTDFYHTGDILYDGTLEGDLLIFSSGDPSFGSPRYYKKGIETTLEIIYKKLKQKNISCIDGNIILIVPNQSYPVNGNWVNEDIANYYGGGTWAFNFNDNEYKIKFDLGKDVGAGTEITQVFPHIPGISISNKVTVGKEGSGDNAYIYGDVLSYKRYIRGTLSDNKNTIRGAIPNPPKTFMKILGSFLDKKGIYHNKMTILQGDKSEKQFLFSIQSPSLLTLAKECNDYSINLYSEAFAKMLCLNSNHPNDYLYNEELEYFFKRYNIDTDKIHLDDGCGLSPKNLVSPREINKFIISIVEKLNLKTVLDIMPQVGKDGHYKNILKKNKNYWMKSGSIEGARNYSGIYKNNNNKYFVFSVMTNNNLPDKSKSIRKNILNVIQQISRNL